MNHWISQSLSSQRLNASRVPAVSALYSCLCVQNGQVAVKAITLPPDIDLTEKDIPIRKMRCELGIWRRLDHPNIVPLLGTASGEDFGSDHRCMVAMWMPNGTLIEYVKRGGTKLPFASRIRLIRGVVSGLEYLHSNGVIHGDFHPGNIMIDENQNTRLTDFGFSQMLNPEDQLSYLWTESIRPGAIMWAAPELLYPNLYPGFKPEATTESDIYSLGSIILFTLSGTYPWPSRGEMENKLKEFQNPPRPSWPVNIPDIVWGLIVRCWSPRRPNDRPSAQEALSFCRDKLEQSFQPDVGSVINVMLFGTLGCGKSSIINLLTEEPVANTSTGVDPCTTRPRWYSISFGKRYYRLWDTMGFRLAEGGDSSPLLPYEQAYAVLRNLTDGINLIILCACKDGIFASLGSLYRLINDFFYGGCAPIALVVTHFDTPDARWWERNQDVIAQKTGIPVQSIPHACITTVHPDRDLSKQALNALLENYATTVPPITTCLDLSSHMAAALYLVSYCGLNSSEAKALVEQFRLPVRPFHVVLFGESGVGMSSVINLLVGSPVANVSSGTKICTLDYRSYEINTGMQRFVVWDTVGFGMHIEDTICGRAIENIVHLIRKLPRQGGVDLLMFCKTKSRLSVSERNTFRLVEEFLCEGQVPAAVIITNLENKNPMDEWWEVNGERHVEKIGRDVIGHACITSLALDDPDDHKFRAKLLESRLSVYAMLEDCVSPRSIPDMVGGISTKLSMKKTGEVGRAPARKMTVKNLVERCGLTKTSQGIRQVVAR